MKVIIVHGIHTGDDAHWMEELAREFRAAGFCAQSWTYGYAHALTTRWQNPKRAQQLAWLIEPGDIVVGHSNGCCLAWMAANLGAQIGGAVFLNPALDSEAVMPAHVPWVNLYPNRQDSVVTWARLFRAHPWGSQGRDGLTVEDPRYLTRFTDEITHALGMPITGHSAIINEGLPSWGPVIVQDVVRQLGTSPA